MLENIASIDWAAIWAAIATITTAIAGIIAAIQNAGKKEAEAEVANTQAFFDPDNTQQMTPTESTPDKSWKMADKTKETILEGKSDEDKLTLTQQIADAENAGYVDYKLVWSGGSYMITYGLIQQIFTNQVTAE